jgi:hypothetical protein
LISSDASKSLFSLFSDLRDISSYSCLLCS